MYTLPPLGYAYDALEPVIDARTMEIHHTKHHQAYLDKLNPVIAKYPALVEMTLEDVMRNLATLEVEEADRKMLRNHGGGHLNHSFFWKSMDPANQPDQALQQEIVATFGSVDEFKQKFSDAAVKQFGSGWAWLVRNSQGTLEIYSTPNQDSPYLNNHMPVVGIDVWEHAYYLQYQNKRADYVAAWLGLIRLIA